MIFSSALVAGFKGSVFSRSLWQEPKKGEREEEERAYTTKREKESHTYLVGSAELNTKSVMSMGKRTKNHDIYCA